MKKCRTCNMMLDTFETFTCLNKICDFEEVEITHKFFTSAVISKTETTADFSLKNVKELTDEEIEKEFTTKDCEHEEAAYEGARIAGAKWYRDYIRKNKGKKSERQQFNRGI